MINAYLKIRYEIQYKLVSRGFHPWNPLSYGSCGCAYQLMPVKVRLESHEELL